MALTSAEIAKRYRERNPERILAARKLRAEGNRGKIKPHLSAIEKSTIEQLHQEGLSFKQIGMEVKRTGNTVARHLRSKHDIRVRPVPSGENSKNWRGGRSLHGTGYWYVRVPEDDPMSVMSSKTGQVAEHRLVMARLLGRPLLCTESVHHIDGIRSNNMPANLQLRQGNHGKHIVMACLDCGSHRLGPIEIAAKIKP